MQNNFWFCKYYTFSDINKFSFASFSIAFKSKEEQQLFEEFEDDFR